MFKQPSCVERNHSHCACTLCSTDMEMREQCMSCVHDLEDSMHSSHRLHQKKVTYPWVAQLLTRQLLQLLHTQATVAKNIANQGCLVEQNVQHCSQEAPISCYFYLSYPLNSNSFTSRYPYKLPVFLYSSYVYGDLNFPIGINKVVSLSVCLSV